MHGNQWVLKIAVLKYYSVSKRGTTAKSNPKQATDPISLHTKFGDNSSNTFPLNERKPCVTPDIGRRTPDIGHRTSDGEKSKNNISTPQGGGHNSLDTLWVENFDEIALSRTVKEIEANLCFAIFGKNSKIQNGRHFWGGENFWKIAKIAFVRYPVGRKFRRNHSVSHG